MSRRPKIRPLGPAVLASRFAPIKRFASAALFGAAVSLASAALIAPPASAQSVATQSRVVLPPARTVTLPNGARIILAEKHSLPLISFQGTLRGCGSIVDPPGKEGLASLTADMLRKGAGKRSAREIAAVTDGAGADLSTAAGTETAGISGEFMARDQDLMIDLVRSLLREPTFPDSEFVKLRDQTVDALRADKDDPSAMLGLYAAAYFYQGHPYGRPTSGDETTVAKLTREDVVACYHENYGGDRLIFTIVGDFDARAMEDKLRRALGDWKPAPSQAPPIPPTSRRAGRHVLLIDKPDATQSYFWIGNRGIARTDPDRVTVDVVNTAFGGRYTSMINTALRIKSGLTYGARVRIPRPTQPGTVAISSFTKTESTQKAIDLALETLEHFRASGLDATTLHSATQYIEGQYPTSFETNGQIAGTLSDLAFHDLPPTEITEYPARVAAVSRPDALKPVIQRVYPSGEDLTIVVVGNAKAIRPMLRKYGPILETSINEPLLTGVRDAKATAAR